MSPVRNVALAKFSALNADTAENAVGGSDEWLLVPISRFKGREGEVYGRTWLFNGESDVLYGVAAFRKLAANEAPMPLVYRSILMKTSNGLERRLTVRVWSASLKVRVSNSAAQAWRVVAHTGMTTQAEDVPALGHIVLTLPVNVKAMNDLVIQFEGPMPDRNETDFPSMELLP